MIQLINADIADLRSALNKKENGFTKEAASALFFCGYTAEDAEYISKHYKEYQSLGNAKIKKEDLIFTETDDETFTAYKTKSGGNHVIKVHHANSVLVEK